MANKSGLTIKQEKFCLKYVEYGCASEAYRFAYDTKNMKDESVHRKAFELLNDVKFRSRIEELFAPMREKLLVSAEKTLLMLQRGQEFDIRRLFKADGSIKHPLELDDDTAAAITGLKYNAYGQPEYKIVDKKGCAELLGKHLKLFVDRVEHAEDPESPLGKLLLSIASKSKPIPDPVGDNI